MFNRLIIIIIFFFFLGNAYAKKDETNNKEQKLFNKVAIDNFETKSEQKKYKYYAKVIPYTIAKKLAKAQKYIILNIPEEIRSLQASGLDSKTPEYKVKMREIMDKKQDADFIVTGVCEVENYNDQNNQVKKRLSIVIQIYNVKKKKSVFIKKKSREVGVFLINTLDDLSAKIDSLVEIYQVENRRKPPLPISPYRGFYHAISNMSFGIDAGKFFVKGKWNNYYNDGEYLKPYILFNTTGILGVSINTEYFHTDTDNNDITERKELEVYAGTIGLHLSLRFSQYFRLTLAPAFGGTITKTYTGDMSEGNMSTVDKKSNDLYFDGAFYFNINLAPVQIRFGGSYKRLFLSEPLELYCVFAGIGYNL